MTPACKAIFWLSALFITGIAVGLYIGALVYA